MTGILDARVPLRLLDGGFADVGERMARVDIAIADGKFAAVRPAGTRLPHGDAVAQDGGQVWLGFADVHTDVATAAPRPPSPHDLDDLFEGGIVMKVEIGSAVRAEASRLTRH